MEAMLVPVWLYRPLCKSESAGVVHSQLDLKYRKMLEILQVWRYLEELFNPCLLDWFISKLDLIVDNPCIGCKI